MWNMNRRNGLAALTLGLLLSTSVYASDDKKFETPTAKPQTWLGRGLSYVVGDKAVVAVGREILGRKYDGDVQPNLEEAKEDKDLGPSNTNAGDPDPEDGWEKLVISSDEDTKEQPVYATRFGPTLAKVIGQTATKYVGGFIYNYDQVELDRILSERAAQKKPMTAEEQKAEDIALLTTVYNILADSSSNLEGSDWIKLTEDDLERMVFARNEGIDALTACQSLLNQKANLHTRNRMNVAKVAGRRRTSSEEDNHSNSSPGPKVQVEDLSQKSRPVSPHVKDEAETQTPLRVTPNAPTAPPAPLFSVARALKAAAGEQPAQDSMLDLIAKGVPLKKTTPMDKKSYDETSGFNMEILKNRGAHAPSDDEGDWN
jgi:hypothetical protein